MKRARDSGTVDMFSEYAPPEVVERFAPERVRAAKCSARIARAAAEAIRDSKHSRDIIAQLMADYLGEHISVAMLDQYTSTANEKNNIPAHRLIALFVVTRDVRLINALLADTDVVAISAFRLSENGGARGKRAKPDRKCSGYRDDTTQSHFAPSSILPGIPVPPRRSPFT